MMMMGLMMSFGLIVPLLIGIVAYALGWRLSSFNQTGPAPTSQTPLEILKARYARDEISREEYEQVHQDLEG